ncbi:MAG TPA: response regulator [Bacteroidota bacterium]|jgi:CheY-like chemotaxis protein
MAHRILVVDDNPTNLKLACDILEMDGYDVSRAADAEEAREALRTNRIDLILMDIELPGTDGLTFTRMLKADETTRAIPVVALTAFAMKGDDAKAFQAGCEGYISKPIDTRRFSGQVSEFLAGKRRSPA